MWRPPSECVVKLVYVSPILSHSASLKPTLDGHFQNATVGFLLPIEEPITISFPLRVYAHNDSQNVSLVCPPLVSPPLCSLVLSFCLTLSISVCLEACHSLIFHPLDTSMSVTNERGWITGLATCIFPELLKSVLVVMPDHVHKVL